MNRYPPVRADSEYKDAATDEQNKKTLLKELERENPQREIVLSLMRQTFTSLSESADVSGLFRVLTLPSLCHMR